MELFKIVGRVFVDDKQAQKALDNIDRKAEETETGLGKIGKIGGKLGGLVATGAAAAGAALGVLGGIVGKTGISYNAMAEQSEVAWKTLLGSQEEAKTMLKDISDFTKATPFETESVDMMAKYMHNAGLEGQDLFDSLMKVSDVASAFAIPASEAEELTRQMSQVRQAGVAYTEDLNVLQDRGVPIYKALSEQMGVTVADVKKMASEGKVSSDIYIKAFDGIAKGVEGASKEQSKTFNGMISTLKDNFKILSGEIMEPFFNKMKEWLPPVIAFVEQLADKFNNAGWKGMMAELLPEPVYNFLVGAFETVKQVVTDSLNRSVEVGKVLWSFFKQNMLPILTSFYDWIQGHMPTIRATVQTVFNKIKEVASGVWVFFRDNILPILSRFYGFIQSRMPQIKSIVESAFKVIKSVIEVVWTVIEDLLLPALKAIWDWVSPYIPKVQTIIENAFDGIFWAVDKVVGVFNDVVGAISSAIDWLSKWNNKEAKKKTVTVEEKRVSSGGIAGGIPRNAAGTNFFKGGLSLVGEMGPELVTLPRGSKISPANETRSKLKGEGHTFNFYPQKAVIDSKDITREFKRLETLYGF